MYVKLSRILRVEDWFISWGLLLSGMEFKVLVVRLELNFDGWLVIVAVVIDPDFDLFSVKSLF